MVGPIKMLTRIYGWLLTEEKNRNISPYILSHPLKKGCALAGCHLSLMPEGVFCCCCCYFFLDSFYPAKLCGDWCPIQVCKYLNTFGGGVVKTLCRHWVLSFNPFKTIAVFHAEQMELLLSPTTTTKRIVEWTDNGW